MYKIIISGLVFITIASCKENKEETTPETAATPQLKVYAELEKANWLAGSWGNTTPEGLISEKWVKINDSVMHGENYFVKDGKDTVFAETVKLAETNGNLVYTVTIPGQNNEKPVPFELTSAHENQLVFENPKHDYPNKIVYNKITNDSLVAEISGIQKGKPASEQFAMKRQ